MAENDDDGITLVHDAANVIGTPSRFGHGSVSRRAGGFDHDILATFVPTPACVAHEREAGNAAALATARWHEGCFVHLVISPRLRPLLRLPYLAALTGLTLAAPRVADACASLQCDGARFALTAMPASAPAIPFQPVSSAEAPAPRLIGPDGATVVSGSMQGSANDRFFMPDAPLVPGAYSFQYPKGCDAKEGTPLEAGAFTVTAAEPLPVRAGAVTILGEPRRDMRQVRTSAGSCYEHADVVQVWLKFVPDPALAAYRDVIRYRTLVDGAPWTETRAGTGLPETESERGPLRVYAACDDRAAHPGRDHGLEEGTHVVEIVPILVGSTHAIEPMKVEVTLACGARRDDDESADGGTADAGTTTAATPSSSGGCSTAARPGDAPGAMTCATLVALVLAGGRRFRRRASDRSDAT